MGRTEHPGFSFNVYCLIGKHFGVELGDAHRNISILAIKYLSFWDSLVAKKNLHCQLLLLQHPPSSSSSSTTFIITNPAANMVYSQEVARALEDRLEHKAVFIQGQILCPGLHPGELEIEVGKPKLTTDE